MKAAVRYYSRGGNVKKMAEAFAKGAGVEAISIDDPRAPITEDVEVLFVGGALYAYNLDQKLTDFIASIDGEKVGRAVCFGSSYLTRRPVFLIQERLKKRGITIAPQAVYSRGKCKKTLLEAIEYFGKTEIERDTSLDGLSPYERMKAMKISVGDAHIGDDLRRKKDDADDDKSLPEAQGSAKVQATESEE